MKSLSENVGLHHPVYSIFLSVVNLKNINVYFQENASMFVTVGLISIFCGLENLVFFVNINFQRELKENNFKFLEME